MVTLGQNCSQWKLTWNAKIRKRSQKERKSWKKSKEKSSMKKGQKKKLQCSGKKLKENMMKSEKPWVSKCNSLMNKLYIPYVSSCFKYHNNESFKRSNLLNNKNWFLFTLLSSKLYNFKVAENDDSIIISGWQLNKCYRVIIV